MRKIAAVVAVLSLPAAGVASGSPVGSAGSGDPVKVADDVFKPDRVSVKKGGTVKWKWTGKHRHSVTEIGDKFGSKVKRKGTYRHKFSKKGKVTIYCKVHPLEMRMKVIVR